MKDLEEFFKNASLEEVTNKLKEHNVEFISTEKRDKLYDYLTEKNKEVYKKLGDCENE